MILIESDNISFGYDSSPLFTNISFKLNYGETLGIIGPNGSGKTSLLKILAGLLSPTKGKINFTPDTKIIESKSFISYVPQRTLFNESLPLSGMDILNLHCEDKDKINEMITLVNMEDKINRRFSLMSGGEKQRILIAQAIINSPHLLILDEPNKGLDSSGQDQLLSILKEAQEKNKMGIIMVDHNINQTFNFCQKILCLGRKTHWHDSKELLDQKILNSIYHCEFEHQMIHMDPQNWGKGHKGHNHDGGCDGDH